MYKLKSLDEHINEARSTLDAAQAFAHDYKITRLKPLDQLQEYLDLLKNKILSRFPKDPKILSIQDKVKEMLAHMKSGKMKHDIGDVQDIVDAIKEDKNV